MTNTGHKTNSTRPWREDCREQCELAAKYISLSNQRFKWPGPVLDELASYDLSTLYPVISESNLIENAGMSLSDTKNLIAELRKKKLDNSLSLEDLVRFGGRTRKKKEVTFHYLALVSSTTVALQSLSARLLKIYLHQKAEDAVCGRPIILHQGTDHERYRELIEREINRYHQVLRRGDLEDQPDLFNETELQEYHRDMAHGLIAQHDGKPGEYRRHPVITNGVTSFVTWQNVPAAMKKFIKDANALINSEENPVFKAARISHDFVLIHPFADFNGRMSRLIVNMVLRYEGLPFFAVIRKKGYIGDLKRADRGDIKPYACRIARAVNRGFEELNRNLLAADLEPLVPASD
jgi:fido (protein-threonine AMPylation protein)